jgi:hypothetical protein
LLGERDRRLDARPCRDRVGSVTAAREKWAGEGVGRRVVVCQSRERGDPQSREPIAGIASQPREPVLPHHRRTPVGDRPFRRANDRRRIPRQGSLLRRGAGDDDNQRRDHGGATGRREHGR